MLLFVLSALTIFHFAAVPVPAAASRGHAALARSACSGSRSIFTALLGLTRAFVPEREQQTMDALVLAPCDRSAIWVAKSIAVFAFLGVAELVALPAFALFFQTVDGNTIAAVAARERRHLRRRHAHRRDGRRRPRARADPAAALPAARDPDRRRRRGRERGRAAASTSPSSRSTTRSSSCSPGRRSSTWSPRPDRLTTSRFARPVYDAAVTETLSGTA